MTHKRHWLCTAAMLLMRFQPLSKHSFEALGCRLLSLGEDMQRRQFIAFLGGAAAAWPLAGRAQQADRVRRIGFLGGGTVALQPIYNGLLQGMRELGYREGKDFVVEWRLAEGQYERFTEFAAEMVRLKVEVIVVSTPAGVRPTQQATSTIPIVMGYSTDPIGSGFVTSLARPGSNVTGLASSLDDIVPKQIELLASAVPGLSRVGLLVNPGNPNTPPVLKSAQASARQAGFVLVAVEAQTPSELEVALVTLTEERVGAVIVIADAFFNSHRRRLVELGMQARLPTMFGQREYAKEGGLMSYGESLFEFYRRGADYVDKILRGAKPGDIPVEQPIKFDLVINLTTAKALGLQVPATLLARADEVIE
jgi:putative tryptophan/tyrosine transport system substrate-binding protein